MSEDERTVWCGNLSEQVTEELLYELFLQAGPVEEVKIPRDSDKRQRSYAFITYVHACSVEYALEVFEGSSLFKRTLTVHRKTRNGPNPAASPKINFKNPTGSDWSYGDAGLQPNNHPLFAGGTSSSADGNNLPFVQSDILSAMAMAMNNAPTAYNPDMLLQLGQQMLGAELPAMYENNNSQKNTYRAKMTHHDRHQQAPYKRDDRYGSSRDSHRRDDQNGRDGRDRDHKRDHRRRR